MKAQAQVEKSIGYPAADFEDKVKELQDRIVRLKAAIPPLVEKFHATRNARQFYLAEGRDADALIKEAEAAVERARSELGAAEADLNCLIANERNQFQEFNNVIWAQEIYPNYVVPCLAALRTYESLQEPCRLEVAKIDSGRKEFNEIVKDVGAGTFLIPTTDSGVAETLAKFRSVRDILERAAQAVGQPVNPKEK
jgi:hypothetical protein